MTGAPLGSGVEPTGAAALTLPVTDAESQGFWQGTAAGELRMQVCLACGRRRFPPLVMCPVCHHTGRAWQAVSGRGTIWSFVVPHPPLLPAWAALAPYNVICVALEEDPTLRLIGNLVAGPDGGLDTGLDEIDPATLSIGQEVEVVFCRRRGPEGVEVSMPEWVRRR